jgi:signal transduction histidine kinase
VSEVKRERQSRDLESVPVKLTVVGPLPPAYVDPTQLGAAVTELLRNAMDAGPSEFIELRAETEEPDGRLCISVVDSGRGMDAETRRRAFEPFFSRRPSGRGAGLGLSMAHRLAEQHGGRLELESAESEGTVARLVIPRWKREGEAPATAA